MGQADPFLLRFGGGQGQGTEWGKSQAPGVREMGRKGWGLRSRDRGDQACSDNMDFVTNGGFSSFLMMSYNNTGLEWKDSFLGADEEPFSET